MSATGDPVPGGAGTGAGAAAPGDRQLRELDREVEAAIAAGDQHGLATLGYGEISLVLGWPREEPSFACKRLPVFPSRARFDAYAATLAAYLEELERAGVRVVATEMRPVVRDDGTVAAYVVQPALDQATIAPEILRRGDPGAGHPLVELVVEMPARAVSPRLGLDAQLANWSFEAGELTYIDVSTPMLWPRDGPCLLDLDLLAQAYPAILRPPLKRWVAPRILDGYRDLRGVYLDLAGNLLKERLGAWLPLFLERINTHLDQRLSEREVHRYYRSDARLWEALLRLRRLDRGWRRLTGRPYPFLLPGRIER